MYKAFAAFLLLAAVGVIWLIVSLLLPSPHQDPPPWSKHDSPELVEVSKQSASRYTMRYGGHLYAAVHSPQCGNDSEPMPEDVELDKIAPIAVRANVEDSEEQKILMFVHRAHLFDAYHMSSCDHPWCVKNR